MAMSVTFRPARPEEVPRLCAITAQAKRQLKGLGLEQWQKEYPAQSDWEEDARVGRAIVAAAQPVETAVRTNEAAAIRTGEAAAEQTGGAAVPMVSASEGAASDRIAGVFAYMTEPEPSYAEIDGQWLTDGAYASMHRVCVADEFKGQGVAGRMFAEGFRMAREMGLPSMRIDTHPGNIPMQHAIAKAGFTYCGRIILVGGDEAGQERWAYEKIL